MQEKLDVMSRDILDLSEAVADLAHSTEDRFNAIDRRFEAVDRRFNAMENKILNKLDELFSSHKDDAVGVARGEVKRHEARYHAVS